MSDLWPDDCPTPAACHWGCDQHEGLSEFREAATRAVVENLGLIWPDEAEPVHEEVAFSVLSAIGGRVEWSVEHDHWEGHRVTSGALATRRAAQYLLGRTPSDWNPKIARRMVTDLKPATEVKR